MGNKSTEVRGVAFQVPACDYESGRPAAERVLRDALTESATLEDAFVSGGSVEVQVQRIPGQVDMHSVRGFDAH